MIIRKMDLSLSENLKLAPVYNRKWIKYQRTERNGYVSLMIPAGRYPKYEVLNATTIDILQLMTGNNTVGNIIDTLCEKYGIDLKSKIVSDLESLIPHLWQLKLISFHKGEVPHMSELEAYNANKDIYVRCAFDNDLKFIVDELSHEQSEDTFQYFSCLAHNMVDDITNLRTSIFERGQVFFVMVNSKDETIRGLIVMGTTMISNYIDNSVATVDSIICEKGSVSEFISLCEKIINNATIKPINKIRSYVLADDIVAQKTFELSGFKKIAYLPKEKGEANVIMLDKML